MSTSTKVKVIDVGSEEVLFTCPVEKLQSAYQFAAQMEELGLDVKIIAPSVTQTLCDSLGIESDERMDYEDSVANELDDHDGSCCVKPQSHIHDAPDKVQ